MTFLPWRVDRTPRVPAQSNFERTEDFASPQAFLAAYPVAEGWLVYGRAHRPGLRTDRIGRGGALPVEPARLRAFGRFGGARNGNGSPSKTGGRYWPGSNLPPTRVHLPD